MNRGAVRWDGRLEASYRPFFLGFVALTFVIISLQKFKKDSLTMRMGLTFTQ